MTSYYSEPPDARPTRRMGAHVFHVECVDLTAQGFPGLTFEGHVDVEVENASETWFISSAHALDAHGRTHRYAPNTPLGEAIVEAIYADERLSELITDACWYHGE